MRPCLLFLFLTSRFFCQTTISGKISDQSGTPIAYVSIGIPGKNVGTLCDEHGRFELRIPANCSNDTLRFSNIGFKTQFKAIKTLQTSNLDITMHEEAYALKEVVVSSRKTKHKTLGTTRYSKDNCTGFVETSGNWKGSEAAILIENKHEVLIESFQFYIIQNKYTDSLVFRLMFYKKIGKDWVGETFLKKPIIFKLGTKQGEFSLPLRDYNITTNDDFFVSLECLMNEMDITKFCYAGSINTPSYYKVKAFSKWHSTRGTRGGGGGADFNVKVSYN